MKQIRKSENVKYSQMDAAPYSGFFFFSKSTTLGQLVSRVTAYEEHR